MRPLISSMRPWTWVNRDWREDSVSGSASWFLPLKVMISASLLARSCCRLATWASKNFEVSAALLVRDWMFCCRIDVT